MSRAIFGRLALALFILLSLVGVSSQAAPRADFAVYAPLIASHRGAAWQPKTPPLATPWTSLVSPDNARPEYPRPQMVRDRWLNLNGEWQFAGDSYASPPFDLDLPEAILVPFPVESALSGIMRHETRMWYRRLFVMPPDWAGQRILLNFDAVDWEATVYVNGLQVGVHRGGYDAFSFDITDQLATGLNELIVRVYDPTDAGDPPLGKQRSTGHDLWHTPSSGIWQTVWLEPVPDVHITRLDMLPDVDQHALLLMVRASTVTTDTVVAVASVGGVPIGTATGGADVALSLPVTNTHLWSPDDPFLYDLQVTLQDDAGPIDQVSSYFGMRKISVTPIGQNMRLTLNNRCVFQLGVIDQGYWPDGLYTAPTDAALRYDIEQAKALGYNVIRKHEKVEPPRWYYWADKLGMMVWQDIPSMRDNIAPSSADQAQFESELREVIDEHRSAPSIVMWVLFNEGWGQFATARLADMVRARDSSRLVDSASGGPDFDAGDVIDTHSYVAPLAPTPTPFRVAAVGQYGSIGLKVDGHTWSDQSHAAEWQLNAAALTKRYVDLTQDIQVLMMRGGLSAAVYAQNTDVEDELDGWQTYDRAITKPDAAAIRAAQQNLIAVSSYLTVPFGYEGAWHFDEGSGFFADDATGNGQRGVLIDGPAWVTSPHGSALQFDGVDAFVGTGRTTLNTVDDYTVSAWVLLDNLDANHVAISQDGVNVSSFMLQYIANLRRFALTVTNSDSTTSGTKSVVAAGEPITGTWYFLTGVYDSNQNEIRLYVDGVLANRLSFTAAWAASGETAIGRSKWAGARDSFWAGQIDEVYVVNRALGNNEVMALYRTAAKRVKP
jgi:hypothetical protein